MKIKPLYLIGGAALAYALWWIKKEDEKAGKEYLRLAAGLPMGVRA